MNFERLQISALEPAIYSVMGPKLLGKIPGLLEGRLGGLDKEDYPDRIRVQSNDYYDALLFANCGSFSEIKRKIYQEIDILGFNLDKTGDIFRPEVIKNTLDLVENSMEGLLRWSREPIFAHTLRIVKRAVDFLNLNRSWSKGKKVIAINPEIAEALLLMCALHDFEEEDIKLEEGGKVKIGKISGETVTTDDTNNAVLKLQNYKDESYSIDMPLDRRDDFIYGVASLKKADDDTDEIQFGKIKSQHEMLIERATLNPQYALRVMLPYLVKVFDRKDNMDTYLLGNKRGKNYKGPALIEITPDTDLAPFQIFPPQGHEVIEKCGETLENMIEFETWLLRFLYDYRLSAVEIFNRYVYSVWVLTNSLITKIGLKPLKLFQFPEAVLYSEVVNFMPSAVAINYLLGKGIPETFRNIKHPFYGLPDLV